MCIHMYVFIYIYIYIERERGIYIYIYSGLVEEHGRVVQQRAAQRPAVVQVEAWQFEFQIRQTNIKISSIHDCLHQET